jgi:Pyridoxamine 5'-phosphate oxidase
VAVQLGASPRPPPSWLVQQIQAGLVWTAYGATRLGQRWRTHRRGITDATHPRSPVRSTRTPRSFIVTDSATGRNQPRPTPVPSEYSRLPMGTMRTSWLRSTARSACACWAAGSSGGWCTRPARCRPVHPVSYTLCRQEIIFRTAQGSILRAAMLRQVLAFEIDDVNPNTRTGWSVLAIGKAHRVTDADRLTALATRLPPSWTTGRPTHTIALPTRLLSGRRLGPVHPTDPWPPTAPTR